MSRKDLGPAINKVDHPRPYGPAFRLERKKGHAVATSIFFLILLTGLAAMLFVGAFNAIWY